jgi:hypothetical protein
MSLVYELMAETSIATCLRDERNVDQRLHDLFVGIVGIVGNVGYVGNE